MSDSYGYLLAELLKRNTELHGKELWKRGDKVKWTGDTRKIIIAELAEYSFDSKLKAFSGLLWHYIRGLDITTRCVYALLLQWAIYLTESNLLGFYTINYDDLLEELRHSIESGAEGVVDGVVQDEVLEEWELMKDYLMPLHDMCESWIRQWN